MFFINWYYIIFMLPFFAFTLITSFVCQSTFAKYGSIQNERNLTGYQAARMMLDAHGLHNVQIFAIPGNLTDHFDPRSNTISLSQKVYNEASVAAVSVACHEVGHAIQYANNYWPLRFRNFIIKSTNIANTLSMPLIVLGIFLSMIGEYYCIIAYVGVFLFGFSLLFQLVTLPVEFNASKRAVGSLTECGIISGNETVGAKKVLGAAAMTYIAALAHSIGELMYLIRLVGISRDD